MLNYIITLSVAVGCKLLMNKVAGGISAPANENQVANAALIDVIDKSSSVFLLVTILATTYGGYKVLMSE
jgi:hypothetical protein